MSYIDSSIAFLIRKYFIKLINKMHRRELILSIVVIVVIIGFIRLSTFELNSENNATVFAQKMPNGSQGLNPNISGNATTSPFRNGVFVMPSICTTPSEILHSTTKSTTLNSTVLQLLKNQVLRSAGHNMTQAQFGRAINMEVCFPAFSLTQLNQNKTLGR